MEFLAQLKNDEAANLTPQWTRVIGENFSDAALVFLRKIFADVAPLGAAWIWVADLKGPRHDNGMPMVIHGFRIEWKRPKPLPLS